jgi:phosphopantothenate-cysteine ligase/phosphopantothenoylcysteine decarboxylase/phosphopantothenate--cysteine ligase
MNLLVTAGNTQTPIDRVRCITNVFTGRTGTWIALEAHRRGHAVTLLTSHPEVVRDLAPAFKPDGRWTVRPYRTFHDLQDAMAELVSGNQFHTLIHAAAVSDYHLAGTYAPVTGAHFDPMTAAWTNGKLMDVSAGKVKSHHPELWLRLTSTPKLADMVRTPWGFRGTFVKFKLEVGVSDAELKETALRSRAQSDADLLVANTLEGKDAVAWIGDRKDGWERVERAKLAGRLVERIGLK